MSKKALNIHLVVIDPQNDFMDMAGAALPVTGAVADMQRLAAMVRRIGSKLEDIHVTLDSHRLVDVGHPDMWRDQNGNAPAPFTMISADDLRNGIWSPRDPRRLQYFIKYAEALAAGGKYPLMVWPAHCLIGTAGHNVQEDLMKALLEWERSQFANVDYVVKGTNSYTEHYGALMAEVPDPSDPTTGLNTDFLNVFAQADIIAVAGEASSHCVLSTVSQIADNIGDENLKKFVLLTDAMSPVAQPPGGPDFPAIALQFQKDMVARGMQLSTTVDFLS